jgi:hypothetical protein
LGQSSSLTAPLHLTAESFRKAKQMKLVVDSRQFGLISGSIFFLYSALGLTSRLCPRVDLTLLEPAVFLVCAAIATAVPGKSLNNPTDCDSTSAIISPSAASQ